MSSNQEVFLTEQQKRELSYFFPDSANGKTPEGMARELRSELKKQKAELRRRQASGFGEYMMTLLNGLTRQVAWWVAHYGIQPKIPGAISFGELRELKPDREGNPHLLQLLDKSKKPPGNPKRGRIPVSADEVKKTAETLVEFDEDFSRYRVKPRNYPEPDLPRSSPLGYQKRIGVQSGETPKLQVDRPQAPEGRVSSSRGLLFQVPVSGHSKCTRSNLVLTAV